jgi:hypothetical protein
MRRRNFVATLGSAAAWPLVGKCTAARTPGVVIDTMAAATPFWSMTSRNWFRAHVTSHSPARCGRNDALVLLHHIAAARNDGGCRSVSFGQSSCKDASRSERRGRGTFAEAIDAIRSRWAARCELRLLLRRQGAMRRN